MMIVLPTVFVNQQAFGADQLFRAGLSIAMQIQRATGRCHMIASRPFLWSSNPVLRMVDPSH